MNHTGFSLPNGISADILHSFSGVLSGLTLKTYKHIIALTFGCFFGRYFQNLEFTTESALDENFSLRFLKTV